MKKVIILFTVLMTSMLAFAQQKEQARFHVTTGLNTKCGMNEM